MNPARVTLSTSHLHGNFETLAEQELFLYAQHTVDIVAILGLARSVEEEAPWIATELGLTAYEVGMMLRAPMPIVLHRTEDRARSTDLVAKLRSRGHDVAFIDSAAVVASEDMFRPRSFRLEAGDIVASANGEERRLPFNDIFAVVRAMHATVVTNTHVTRSRSMSIGRAVMTGGLLMTKATTTEAKKISSEREPVAYLFRNDAPPWLLVSTELRYEALGSEMQHSQMANFDVVMRLIREQAPSAQYDARLLNIRPQPNTLVSTSSQHLAASSSGIMDLLAHLVALSLARAARPYR